MTSITQDMRYRLSLMKYAEKYGVTKAAIRYKTFIVGNADMTAQSSPYAAVPVARIIIRISIHRKK